MEVGQLGQVGWEGGGVAVVEGVGREDRGRCVGGGSGDVKVAWRELDDFTGVNAFVVDYADCQ